MNLFQVNDLRLDKSVQVRAQARRDLSAADHDARLHVLLECVPG